MANREFIYHMQGLTKAFRAGKKVLDNVHLSFYPDAKIGVLGVNGSGKSTLLRIMAGIDKEFTGEGWVAEGARVGYLPQEPQLDPAKTVRENVDGGRRRAKQAILDRYNELAMNYSDETADEMTRAPGRDRRRRACGISTRRVDQAMDALGCPPGRLATSTKLSGGEQRRVALCKLLLAQPELLLLDEPTNHLDAETVAWLESAPARTIPGAILIVTHDRYFLDNVTGWILELDRGRGIPYEGNYSSWLEQKQKRLRAGGPRGGGAPAHDRARARVDRGLAEGPPGQVARRASSATRISSPRAAERGADDRADRHPDRRAARQQRHRVRGPLEGLRRQAADRRTCPSSCRRAASSA